MMSLKYHVSSLRTRLEETLEVSQHLNDKRVAQILDDILLRQKFWAEDVGFDNDPYSSMSKDPSDAVETMEHLAAMRPLLSEILTALSPSSKGQNQSTVEKAGELQIMNDRFCDSEEIFDILDSLEDLEPESKSIIGRHESSHPFERYSTLLSSRPQAPLSMDEPTLILNSLIPSPLSVMKEKPPSKVDKSTVKSKSSASGDLSAMKEKPPSKVDKLTVKLKSSVPGDLSAMKEKPPSKVDKPAVKSESSLLGNLAATREKKLTEVDSVRDFAQLVEEAARLITIVAAATEKVSQEICIGFKIERYRLRTSASLHLSKKRASKPTMEISHWKLFEAALSPVTRRLKNWREIYVMKAKNASKSIGFFGVLENEANKDPLSSLGKILKSLSNWNDSFNTLCDDLEQESLRRHLRTHCSTSLAMDLEQTAQLRKAAAELGHEDIKHMAQAIVMVNNFYKESPARYMTLSPQYDLVMESKNIRPPLIVPQKGEPRHIVEYYGSKIIIDWYEHDASDAWREIGLIRHRTKNLAELLTVDLQATGLSVLRCVGYIEIEPNLTALGFHVPSEVGSIDKPITLHELLEQRRDRHDHEMPDLGERFDLAKALVNTVFGLHTIDWITHRLLPHNILFWPGEGALQRWEIRKPYVVGFDMTGFGQPGDHLERPATLNEDNLYLVADVKLWGHGSYHAEALYSLGVVLFEIGCWDLIASIEDSWSVSNPNSVTSHIGEKKQRSSHRDRLPPDFALASDFFHDIAGFLRRNMGSRYAEAALACIEFDPSGLWRDEYSGEEEDIFWYFQSKIVDPIARCSA